MNIKLIQINNGKPVDRTVSSDSEFGSQLMQYFEANIEYIKIYDYREDMYHEFKLQKNDDIGNVFVHVTHVDIRPRWRRTYTYSVKFSDGEKLENDGLAHENLYDRIKNGDEFYGMLYYAHINYIVNRKNALDDQRIYDAETERLNAIGQVRKSDYINKIRATDALYDNTKYHGRYLYSKEEIKILSVDDPVVVIDRKMSFVKGYLIKCPEITVTGYVQASEDINVESVCELIILFHMFDVVGLNIINATIVLQVNE